MKHLMELIDRWQQERGKWAADSATDPNDAPARYAAAIFDDHIRELREAMVMQLQSDLTEIITDITNENGLGIVETAQTANTTDSKY